eukprot:TRINITY_DN11406_c0_g1_i1.p1 TRINITY_DN11406_c0_g1~~TRINITY_DN11406_c0_g1_i1.p1  ORF type:complete len:362 (+),score=80.55 TRINITY_DN11406_c0_g1_i1:31-1086(+)
MPIRTALLASMAGRPRLVLHFDLNETILIGDPASGVSVEESLECILAKVACVQKGEDRWHDGTPFGADRPPPPLLTDFFLPRGTSIFYRSHRALAKTFTSSGPGVVYRRHLEDLKGALQCAAHDVLAPSGMPTLLPSFFHCISTLQREGRDFRVVFRTFGEDLPRVRDAMDVFAAGGHPDFSPVEGAERFNATAGGECRLRRTQDGMKLLTDGSELTCEDAIAGHIKSKPVLCVRDHYEFWKDSRYVPASGKPVWVTLDDVDEHHIFFDDNIHDNPRDSIVGVRARETAGAPFHSVSGDATRQLEGSILVKVHAYAACLDRDYFLKKIASCESRLREMREDGSLRRVLMSV